MKTLPKSLHTVSALVNVARIYTERGHREHDAVDLAASLLGYTDEMPECDPYGLMDKARAILAKGI